jgi:hypothetical protein
MAASTGTNLPLHPSAARTVSGTGPALDRGGLGRFLVQLNVTAASGTTPTLDVYLQTSVDGTNWHDVGHFAQVTAAGIRFLRLVLGGAIPAVVEEAQKDASLAAGTVEHGPAGKQLRVKYVIAGTTPSFTFEVLGGAEEDS